MIANIIFWVACPTLSGFLCSKVMKKIDCSHPDPFGIWAMPGVLVFFATMAAALFLLHKTGWGVALKIIPFG